MTRLKKENATVKAREKALADMRKHQHETDAKLESLIHEMHPEKKQKRKAPKDEQETLLQTVVHHSAAGRHVHGHRHASGAELVQQVVLKELEIERIKTMTDAINTAVAGSSSPENDE